MRHFEATLNYSSANEDWRTELAALQPDAGGPVLCITGSGDRPLNLLARTTARIVSIDCNPAQNHLLRLKIAALHTLPFDEYAAFLGLWDAEPGWRIAAYRTVARELPAVSRQYWARHRRHIARGVIYAGRFERHFRRIGRFARLVRGRRIERLFGFHDLEQQRSFVREEWDTRTWRLLFNVVVCPVVSRLVFGDPAFYRYASVPVGTTLHRRMCRALEQTLARECFMMGLVFRGRLPEADLPPYLTPESAEIIRERLPHLDIVDDRLERYLNSDDTLRFTRFSLSDVPSFCADDEYRRLIALILGRAAPGARIVIRQFLTRYELPREIEWQMMRERELEETLARQDHAFAYEFVIATLRQ